MAAGNHVELIRMGSFWHLIVSNRCLFRWIAHHYSATTAMIISTRVCTYRTHAAVVAFERFQNRAALTPPIPGTLYRFF